MESVQFSVIIPTLNEEHFVGKLLISLSKQMITPFEVIVVDGNSKDKTVAIAESFAGKIGNLRVIGMVKPSVSLQRNMGASSARGEWLVFVDADTILLPHFFERIGSYIRESKPTFFTTWFRPDSESGNDALLILFLNMCIEGAKIIRRPSVPGGLMIMKKSVFDRAGGFDEAMKFGEDYDMTRRIVRVKGKFTMLRETLYVWSLRRNRREGNFKLLQKSIIALLSVLLINRAPQFLSWYPMGSALSGYQKKLTDSIVRRSQRILIKYWKEIFS